ncbi:MAG: patatin-like phospholipase family protein [Acidobacteria bacterium]|nr:patatin-like phospholipase family protein [Acidobacteriota bacterium]
MRALHDRGVLSRVAVISSVSGGSVIAGLYSYRAGNFDDFDRHVVQLLERGLHRSIVRHLFSPKLFVRVMVTNLTSRPIALLAKLLGHQPPLRRWASRTDALEGALRDYFGSTYITDVARPHLDVVINACELRTGTAFRFGNRRSGTWRFGEVRDNKITVAHAVACSAAYPMLLPAFDREYEFARNGVTRCERAIVTDGGVYDNLGISCLEPDRDDRYSLHTYSPDYIICCYAGHGQFSGANVPFGFYSRATAAFESVFRKAQDAAVRRLHIYQQAGRLKGFILAYLGQQDEALPLRPPDLVRRDQVFGYPTNFAAMRPSDIELLTLRGEQLTQILLSHYCPEIAASN